MRKWITLLMTLLVGCGASYANANIGQVTFDAGYRHDTINWSHRFPSNDPLVSTNTRFKDIDIFQIGLHGRTTVGCNFYVRGDAYWGWILDGEYERSFKTFNSISDAYYSEDNNLHFGLSDRLRSTIDSKYVFGVGAAIGYPFYFCDCSIIMAPVIGYAFDEQNIRADDKGFDFGNYGSEDFGGCCRHTFISRWYGPFVGVDFDYRPWNSCLNIWAELEWHWATFSGRRSNLNDYYSFENERLHSNDARAWVFGLGADYDLCNDWTIGIALKFQDWTASRHHKLRESLPSDVSTHHDRRIRENNKWRSYAINLTFGREF